VGRGRILIPMTVAPQPSSTILLPVHKQAVLAKTIAATSGAVPVFVALQRIPVLQQTASLMMGRLIEKSSSYDLDSTIVTLSEAKRLAHWFARLFVASLLKVTMDIGKAKPSFPKGGNPVLLFPQLSP